MLICGADAVVGVGRYPIGMGTQLCIPVLVLQGLLRYWTAGTGTAGTGTVVPFC